MITFSAGGRGGYILPVQKTLEKKNIFYIYLSKIIWPQRHFMKKTALDQQSLLN